MTSSLPDINLDSYLARLENVDPFVWSGEVVELVGLLIESRGPAAAVGDFCAILASGGRVIRTQVIGFRNGNLLSMALEEIDGLRLYEFVTDRVTDQFRNGVDAEFTHYGGSVCLNGFNAFPKLRGDIPIRFSISEQS